jgi:hypothetical protein
MNSESYTRDEVVRLGGESPQRGPYCPKCGAHIPQFEELTSEDVERMKNMIRAGKGIEVITELRRLTGCSISWAQIWIFHPDGPRSEDKGAPCPFCDKPLRTKSAKQCRHCKRDWHDPQATAFLA